MADGHIALEDWYWRRTVEKMYEPGESEFLTQKLQDIVDQKRNMLHSKINTRKPQSKTVIDASI
jgi:hypothetical protein